jgi:hypothetical protein
MLTAQNRTLASGAELLKAGARAAASDTTRARLEEMGEFYELNLEAMKSARRRWRERNGHDQEAPDRTTRPAR